MWFGEKNMQNENSTEFKDELEQQVFDKPLIALFDTDASVKELLTKNQFSCIEATLGSCIKIPNKERNNAHHVHLNSQYPENLHEFDIIVFDITKTNYTNYSSSNKDYIKTQSSLAFWCEYPQTIFDPRPYTAKFLIQDEIEQILKRNSVVIIFCGSDENAHYDIVDIKKRKIVDEKDASIFDFYYHFPSRTSKTGKILKLPNKETKLSPLISKYLPSSSYEMIFEHPRDWQNGKLIKLENFHPLAINKDDEIVSFCHFIDNGAVFVFPNIANKDSFLLELCNVYFPETFPDIFPHHGQFSWLESDDYLLPREFEFRQQKIELQQQYEKKLEEIEGKIEDYKKEHQFLHELLYQTGDDLVKAVELYLKWLGFDSVINMDETNPEIKEEDLQIETDKGLLVIEIKGIGGTSTDKECSQIHKIITRRAKQQKRSDVFGLYIVNHQRYKSPKLRANPPFTEHQINDATHDERGLLTTYELYKAYFLIEGGIITKEEVKEQLFNFGLIHLEPSNLKSIGICNEIFQKGKIAILNLDGQIELSKGCELITKKNNEYRKVSIESIQLDGKDVEKADTSEVGLRLNIPIKKGTEFFINA